VTHELGHILGLDHGVSFMAPDLDAGERLVGELVFDDATGSFHDPTLTTETQPEEAVSTEPVAVLDDEDWIIEI
jgi:hypothetical protein